MELKLVVIVPTGEIRGLAVASEKIKRTLPIEPSLIPWQTIASSIAVAAPPKPIEGNDIFVVVAQLIALIRSHDQFIPMIFLIVQSTI